MLLKISGGAADISSKDIDDCLYSKIKGVDKIMYTKTEQVRYAPFIYSGSDFTE